MQLDDSTVHAAVNLSLLVVDPFEVIRTGLSVMASAVPFVTEVDSCHDPASAQKMLSYGKIDAMLISASYGSATTKALRTEANQLNVRSLIVIPDSNRPPGREILEMAMQGFLELNTLTTETLSDSLQRLMNNQLILPVKLLRSLLQEDSARLHSDSRTYPVLTPREHQILGFIAEGMSNKQIARRIAISEHGVKRHVSNLLAKLNAPNRTQAVSQALQAGILRDNGNRPLHAPIPESR